MKQLYEAEMKSIVKCFFCLLLSMFPLDKVWSFLVFVDEKVHHQVKVAVVPVRKKKKSIAL